MPHDRPTASLVSFKIRDGKPQIDFETYLPFNLTAIANRIARGASRTYLRHFGVGINEWRILSNLRAAPRTTANGICRQSGLDKAAVSRSLRLLQDAGLVAADADAAIDVRGRSLQLTAKGSELHDRMMNVALEREQRLLTGFSDAERRLLLSLVARLHANVPLIQEAGQ